ncbi:transcription termination factor MTERF9, chloroplastic [Impatiens glandulifera]|uniref:transcription termination factor MTERF9, chloroplastic n=1 Tax=Impatiens glandulifera TaxID=253017 RepID=UPI001FB18FDD|nr:transcription termination factor MTERF9, chloroplastic [Impatiens glandulifera]
MEIGLDYESEETLGGNIVTVNAEGVLRSWGCSESEIGKLFERFPSMRKYGPDTLQSKLNILGSLGLTASDLIRTVQCRPRLFRYSLNKRFDERIEYFLGLFKTKEVLRKVILRNPSLLTYNFENQIKPVVSLYEEIGITGNDFVLMLLSRPTLIPRTSLNDEKWDYIHKTGVSKESKMYKYVVTLVAISRVETIREKLANIEKFGLSTEEVLGLIGRSPYLLTMSTEKVQRNMTFVCGTMKMSPQVVVKLPVLLQLNLESKLKPRFRLVKKIEEMGLVSKVEESRFLSAIRMTEKRFIEVFIDCYPQDVAQELMEFYTNMKCVKRLAESSKKEVRKGFPF